MTSTEKSVMFMKIYILLLFCVTVNGRIHKLNIENDLRSKIDLTTFGFVKDGRLTINLTNFHFDMENPGQNLALKDTSFGFTLDKTSNDNLQETDVTCVLREIPGARDKNISMILFTMNLTSDPPCLHLVRLGEDMKYLNISIPSEEVMKHTLNSSEQKRKRRSLDFLADSYLFPLVRSKRDTEESVTSGAEGNNVEEENQQENVEEKEEANPETGNTENVETKAPGSVKNKPPENDESEKVGTEVEQQYNETSTPVTQVTFSSTEIPSDVAVNQTNVTSDPHKPVTTKTRLVNDTIPLKKDPVTGRYSTYFLVDIRTDAEEGLYNLFFHSCDNYKRSETAKHKVVHFTIHLAESNYNVTNYLSAGQIPLPSIYMILCVVYFVLACIWWPIIRRATEGVFKTHYLMLIFLFVKCISLFFHSINFHFIEKEGHHEAAFAILYYITYLMKGTLLFVTIVLVGAGWAFVKHILSKRDKKIFIIVIPLQILANVAQIIIEETEEGQSQYLVWKQLFIMLDLLCCGAILFPVIWSIKHLQDASQTDGKAAINLCKLKIFRHFYIMVVCYIYFTRIIVYLLAMTLPFQYTWMCTVFKEAAALMFFVMTGYKFRPASDNPYLQIPQSDDEDVEMDQVLTESGVTEGLTRVNIKDPSGSTGTVTKQRESSHEYD